MEFSSRGFMFLVLVVMSVTVLIMQDKTRLAVVSPVVLEHQAVEATAVKQQADSMVSTPKEVAPLPIPLESPVKRRNGLIPPPPAMFW